MMVDSQPCGQWLTTTIPLRAWDLLMGRRMIQFNTSYRCDPVSL